MTYSVPGKVGGTNQSVNGADINKHTVVLNGANLALKLLTYLDCFPELSSLGVANFLVSLLDRADYSAALLVDFDNLERNCFLYKVGQLAAARNACLRSGDKYARAVCNNDNSALYVCRNNAFKRFARIVSCCQLLHADCSVNSLL